MAVGLVMEEVMVGSDTGVAKPAKRPKVLRGLHLGLPNHWYPILQSERLGRRPIRVRRFGEELVVWRDVGGRPHVLDNRCPHRGAPLCLGSVRGEALACAYHGWAFNAAGQCIDMPLEPEDSKRISRIGIKAYAAEERGGYIWMFYGERDRASPLSTPVEIEDDEWFSFRTDYNWETNWLNVLDNIVDPLHAIYLHTGATTQKKRAKFKNFEITHDDQAGFRLGKVGYRDDGSIGAVEGEVEFLFPNVLRLDIADGTNDGLYRVLIMPTPVDEDRACAFYVRARRGRGWKRLNWRLWWAIYGRAVHRVAAQDCDVMSGIGPISEARLREHLASSDVGVMHLRKRLNQAFFRIHDKP